MSVHICEQEIPYGITTKRSRSFHHHHRGIDPDPDGICFGRESARGPSAGTKRKGHRRGHHSHWYPCMDSHPVFCRFGFRQSSEQILRRYKQ